MSDVVVIGSGAVTFKSGATAYGGINFTAANTLQFSDNAGGTTGKVTLANIAVGTPSASTDPATKGYVDSVAQGLKVKDSCVAATTASFTVANSSSTTTLVLATDEGGFDDSANTLTIDSYVITEAIQGVGVRVMIKDGVNVSTAGVSNKWNGIYTVGLLSGSTCTLTRATDMDGGVGEFAGAFALITDGNTNAGRGYTVTEPDAGDSFTLGTTDVVFTQFSSSGGGGGFDTAGSGLTSSSTTVSLNVVGTTAITAGTLAAGDSLIVYDLSATANSKALMSDVATYVQGAASALTFGSGLGSSIQTFTTSAALAITDANHVLFFVSLTGATMNVAAVSSITDSNNFTIGGTGKPVSGDKYIVVKHKSGETHQLVGAPPALVTLTEGTNYNATTGVVTIANNGVNTMGGAAVGDYTVFSFTNGSPAITIANAFDLTQNTVLTTVYGTKSTTGNVNGLAIIGKGVYTAGSDVTPKTVASEIADATFNTGIAMAIDLDIDGLTTGNLGDSSVFPMDENGAGMNAKVAGSALATYVQGKAAALTFGSGLTAGDYFTTDQAMTITDTSHVLFFVSAPITTMDVSTITALTNGNEFTINPANLGTGTITLLVIKAPTGVASTVAINMVVLTDTTPTDPTASGNYNSTNGKVFITSHGLTETAGDHIVFALTGSSLARRNASFDLNANVSTTRVAGIYTGSGVMTGDTVVGKGVYTAGASVVSRINVAIAPADATYATGSAVSVALDLSTLSSAVLATTVDSIAFLDATDGSTKLEAVSDFLSLIAGSGITVSSGQLTLAINILGTAAVADGDLLVFADVNDSNNNKKLTVGELDTYLSATVKTLTNKTLTTPKFAHGGYIADSAGLEHLVFDETTSAVNHFQMTNAATGSGPILAAVGGDTDVSLDLKPKGTGVIRVGTGAASGILQSKGDFDLILRTGNSTTGTITITDGANGDITLAPDGTGLIVASSHLQMAAGKNIELVAGHYIRTGSNATLLQCNNDGLVVNGSVTSSSDARLKQNFSRCGGVDVVKRLTGWQWDWRSNGLTSSGVIAQEVRDVLPYAVQENENGLSVNYNALHGVIIEAIKDLASEVETMRAERQRYNLRPRYA